MSAWTRERWATAQINACCNALDLELHSIVMDGGLTPFQKSILLFAAIESASESLAEYDWFRQVAV